MNLDNLNLVELDAQEVEGVTGGFTLFRWRGFLDGIAGNTEITILGIHIV
jgi:hypothetical protein